MTRTTRIHRKVEPALWFNDAFRALSAPKPNAQTLWLYLLTGPRTTMIPGVVMARPAVMADDLRWPLKKWIACMKEIADAGMAEIDADAGLVVLKNALIHNGSPRETSRPNSPNAVKAWWSAFENLPSCELRERLRRVLQAFLAACWKENYNESEETKVTAFERQAERRSVERSDGVTDGVGTQDQDQDQKQEDLTQERARVGALTEYAIRRLNEARFEVDPRARPIPSLAVARGADAERLRTRLRETRVQDRQATLDHVIDVTIAEAKNDGHVGKLSLVFIGGDVAWPRQRDATVASVTARARDSPSHGSRDRHQPEPTKPKKILQ